MVNGGFDRRSTEFTPKAQPKGVGMSYWLAVLGATVVTVGSLGLIWWRLRVGYRETMDRVAQEKQEMKHDEQAG